uniref:G-protein coupled receptors family 1 profile domain-containing protein n=1 Tax=Kryptolebias marmoratus TaxID=37003 RepID=A0A3Q3BA76_KRYMA
EFSEKVTLGLYIGYFYKVIIFDLVIVLLILRQNPRYILFIHLVLNETIQLLSSLLLYIFALATIFVSLCVLFLLPAILATVNIPLNLACMVTECYISVCVPLHYNNICTVKRTKIVIGVIWAISILSILPDVFILFITEDPQFISSRVFCDREMVFRSSYSFKKRDATHTFLLVVVCLTLFYTYFRIFFVANAAKADASKARKTILLHGFQMLLGTMAYAHPLLIQFLLYFFPKGRVVIKLTTFVIIQIIPRFLSPAVYGLRDKTFRKYLKKNWICL